MLRDFDSLWDFSRPREAESVFRSLLTEAGPHAPATYRLCLRTQIARTLGLQRRFDEAAAELDAVEHEAGEIDWDAEPVVTIRLLLERGRVLNSSGKPELAAPIFEQAFAAAGACGMDDFAVDAAHMLAIVSRSEHALEWNLKALALAESSHNPRARRWRASLANNIGWTHHAAGRFEEAFRQFERALELRHEAGKPGDIRIAQWCIARCLRSLGRAEDALAAQRELAAKHAAAGTADPYVQEELGECLFALSRPASEYAPHFRRAHELLSADANFAAGNADRLSRIERLATGRG